MSSFVIVAFGGFLGSIIRFWLAEQCKTPWGTWVVNITGSVLLAIIFKFYVSGYFSSTIWLFWGIGFAGAYTTFSTFGKETLELLLSKRYMQDCYMFSHLSDYRFFLFRLFYIIIKASRFYTTSFS